MADVVFTAFNGGEVSPDYYGRTDQAAYYTSAKKLKNMLVVQTGQASSRGGSMYVAETKFPDKRAALIDFTFSDEDAYEIEMGDKYMRFYKNRGQIVNAPVAVTISQAAPALVTWAAHGLAAGHDLTFATDGALPAPLQANRPYFVRNPTADTFELGLTPGATASIATTDVGSGAHTATTAYEIVSPYAEADLFDSNDIFQLQYDQTNDFLYLAHPTIRNKQVTRANDTSWTIEDYQPINGPYMNENLTDQTLTYAGAVTVGSAGTLASSEDFFDAGHVGAFFMLRKTVEDTPPWQTGQAYALNAVIHNQGLYYICTEAGTAGAEPPTHSEGSAYDGPVIATNCKWLFLHAGHATFRVTSFTDLKNVDVDVVTPADSFAAVAIQTWREGAWSDYRGYPRAVGFIDEHQVWAATKTQPTTNYFSEINHFEHYAPFDADGQITDTTAFNRTLTNNNPIRWVHAGDKGLHVGTLGGEWLISTATLAGVLTPTETQAKRYSERGASSVPPVQVGDELVYTQLSRHRLRNIEFNLDKSQMISKDLNIRASHVLLPRVVHIHWAEEPHHIVWCVLNDGTLAALTYNDEDDVKVKGWHTHVLGGTDAFVEDVSGIPAPDLLNDDVWLIVRRTINGETRRYIEILKQPNVVEYANSCYLDSSLGYNGAPLLAIGGFFHLIGETVQLRVDGKNHPDKVVDSLGQITLAYAGSVVEVGFYEEREVVLLPIEFTGETQKTAVGRKKLTVKARVRVVDTVGGEIGMILGTGDTSPLVPLEMENALSEYQDMPPVEITALSEAVALEGEHTVDGSIVIKQRNPQPFNMTQVVVRL